MSSEQVITFGCRLNSFESEIISKYTEQFGLQDFYFINTCAVTAEAERQAMQKIRHIKRHHPSSKIVVTGCMAQMFYRKLEQTPYIDFIIGNEEKLLESTYQALKNGELPRVAVSDPNKIQNADPTLVTRFDRQARAFVQIQNGCSNNCAYCLITKARGPSRSVSVQGVVNQVKTLATHYPEIVLTGINIAEYGKDISDAITLNMLLKRILNLVPELEYISLSSMSPCGFSDELVNTITTESRVLPYIHLSIQSGDNEILRSMRREPYTREDVISLSTRLKDTRPDILLGADIITGFPGESDEQFQNTLKLVDEAQIDFLHVFPFSKRIGTEAYYMENQIDRSVAKLRLKALQTLADERFIKLLENQINKQIRFIAESEYTGKTINHIPVKSHAKLERGKIYQKTVLSHNSSDLLVE